MASVGSYAQRELMIRHFQSFTSNLVAAAARYNKLHLLRMASSTAGSLNTTENGVLCDTPITTISTDTASTGMKNSKRASQYFVKYENNNSKKWDGKVVSMDLKICMMKNY